MTVLLFFSAALCAWLLGAWNPAITLSRRIYHRDIRTCGSGNPGFTNFKRSFGNRWAWWVFALDLSKAALVVALFAALFERQLGMRALGAAYTGLFAMLGHVWPVWYGFHGGKGFLVSLSTLWVLDWRAGLAATAVMVVLLLATRYMSVATVTSMLLSPLLLALLRTPLPATAIMAAMVLLLAVRHRENFRRLREGTENRFHLKKTG